MKKRLLKSDWRVIFIIFSVLYFLLIIVLNFCIRNWSKTITVSSDIIRTSATIATLIITFLLFDRFGLKKKIFDERADVVLKLAKELKKLSLVALYVKNDIKLSALPIYPSKSNNREIIREEILQSYIVFNVNDFVEGTEVLMDIKNDVLLPPSIASKMEFLTFMHAESVLSALIIRQAMLEFSFKVRIYVKRKAG